MTNGVVGFGNCVRYGMTNGSVGGDENVIGIVFGVKDVVVGVHRTNGEVGAGT